MDNKNAKKEKCKMCGKRLPAQDMFKGIKDKEGLIYLCCQICYELYTGKPLSAHPDIEYK